MLEPSVDLRLTNAERARSLLLSFPLVLPFFLISCTHTRTLSNYCRIISQGIKVRGTYEEPAKEEVDSSVQAILIITYYGEDEGSGRAGTHEVRHFPRIKRSEQPGTRFSLFLRYLRVIHVEDRARVVTLLMPATPFIFYAYILLALAHLPDEAYERRLNRNATRALTFYSPETIDRYRYGKYITAPMPGSLGELLRLIHTGRRYYPAGFPRLIRKPLENRIALFHPARRPIARPQPSPSPPPPRFPPDRERIAADPPLASGVAERKDQATRAQGKFRSENSKSSYYLPRCVPSVSWESIATVLSNLSYSKETFYLLTEWMVAPR